jgi:tRNA (guanine37-N1)-methyltransferase
MSLKEKLKGIIPEEKLSLLPNRFNIIGGVAIVSIPTEIEDYKKDIAAAIISKHRKIKTVLNKSSKLEDDRRVASFETLAGGETVTLHREFGFAYRLDVAEVFFNSRLAYERKRIASMVKPGEWVLIPFCGVGPFAVPIAARGAKVVALEKNPVACKFLTENAKLNRAEENVLIINGDAFRAVCMLDLEFDRAVIPAPYGMDNSLETISPVVKKGGMIHFYTFKKRNQIEEISEKYRDMGFEVQFYRRCGNVAPEVSRWAFDLVKS